ncbi:MAG: DUF1015 domain-containing protein [Oscillospiraceae bacterium]|nr:DUF1015 domain-containing protein [Oscillospiraceae bacterium]
MAEIKSFKGLRYTEKAGAIAQLCCPPYDIIDKATRERFLQHNPHNIIRLELPKPLSDTTPDDQPYALAAQILKDWLSKGLVKAALEECLYVYEMEFQLAGSPEFHSVKGFISLVKLEEFSKGIILPHEETLSKAKTDRLKLMEATGCNFSQIYSLYMDENAQILELITAQSLNAPDSEFTDGDNVTHRLWCVSDSKFIEKVTTLMADKKIYIADGHHRYETALNYRNNLANRGVSMGASEYVPMMLVNIENPGLVVFPTHRIVRGLANFDYAACLEKCAEFFDVTQDIPPKMALAALEQAYRDEKKAFLIYTKDSYTLIVLKEGVSVGDSPSTEAQDKSASELLQIKQTCSRFATGGSPDSPVERLDVSVLHTLVLDRILGIDKENMTNQTNLVYTKTIAEALAAVDSANANCAFLLNPTRISEIRDVAANGEKMPQKSTYFYPKLTTGLVFRQLTVDS